MSQPSGRMAGTSRTIRLGCHLKNRLKPSWLSAAIQLSAPSRSNDRFNSGVRCGSLPMISILLPCILRLLIGTSRRRPKHLFVRSPKIIRLDLCFGPPIDDIVRLFKDRLLSNYYINGWVLNDSESFLDSFLKPGLSDESTMLGIAKFRRRELPGAIIQS